MNNLGFEANRRDFGLFTNEQRRAIIGVGDKMCVMTSPDGVDYLFSVLHSTNAFLRCPLIDS